MGMIARAELTVDSGLVVAFIAVTPIMLAVFNLVYRIYPSRGEIVGMLIGLAGVLMLTQGEGYRASPAGLLEVTIAELGWSLGSALSQRRLTLAPGAMGFATEMLCGGIVLLGLSALSGERFAPSTPAMAWLAWGYLVTFGSLVSFSAYMVLLGRVPSSVASSYTCVNPVVAMLLGVAVGGEHIAAWEWTSAGVVLCGVMLLLFGGQLPGVQHPHRSDNILFDDGAVIDKPLNRECAEIECAVPAVSNQLTDPTTRSGRLLHTVPAESVTKQ
jgi:drug/metabolite transporter (DMT)-like permease